MRRHADRTRARGLGSGSAWLIAAAYRCGTWLATPLVRAYLARRVARGKEDATRLPERFGIAAEPRPEGTLIWAHGASVGESLALLPLINRLIEGGPDRTILVTTGTVTSAAMLGKRLPPGALHQFVPVDLPQAVERFLDHWKPDLALWVESELWPNLIQATARRGIPMALVNARLSERSFDGWRRVPRLAAMLLRSFSTCLAQSEADAERLRTLGAANVQVAGNIKFASEALPSDTSAHDALEAAIGTRPRWLAASTHEGEEEIALGAHRLLSKAVPGILLLLAPRHPQRGAELAARLSAEGFAVRQRSKGEPPAADTDIYLADTLGELGTLFRLAPVAMIGGSFQPHGGHNPFEPALLESAILFGPHMENFAVIARDLLAAGGAIQVADATSLAESARRLLCDAALRRSLTDNAGAVAASYAGVLDKTLAALAPLLARADGHAHAGA